MITIGSGLVWKAGLMANGDGRRLAITGFGLITPVGVNAWQSAASMRAGIVRFHEYERVLVDDDPDGLERCGATVAHAPVELEVVGAERAAAMLAPALSESLRLSQLPADRWVHAHWWLDSLIEGPADSDSLIERLRRHGVPVPASVPAGGDGPGDLRHCRVFEMLIQAAERLRQGPASVAIIGCADSLSTSPSLEGLRNADRLKSGSRPEGIIPGEAAGALIVETESHARGRGARIYAYLTSWGSAQEPNPWTGTTPSKAEGLTQAFHQAFEGREDRGEAIGLVIADLNGERPRALEWALSEQRVFPLPPQPAAGGAARRLWRPGDHIGDCGGATGAVQVAWAAIAVAKGYARTDGVALMTSDDAGARRVVCLAKADTVDSYRPILELIG